MREFTIGKNDAGQRLDRFLSKAMPLLPPALLQKYIRIKRVKCNGARCQRDQRLGVGDVLQVYINDEFFDRPTPENASSSNSPGRTTCSSPSSSPVWTSCMRTRTSCWWTSAPDWWSTRTRRRR